MRSAGGTEAVPQTRPVAVDLLLRRDLAMRSPTRRSRPAAATPVVERADPRGGCSVAKILMVDDEAQVLAAIDRGLARAGHQVVTARTAQDGLAAAASASPDLVLLELRLPDLEGIEVLRRLRSWTRVPVLLLSGDVREQLRVAALDAGADDFIDKPFAMEELRARVDAALRRSVGCGLTPPAARIRCGEVAIDLAGRELSVAEEPVRLTPTQWRLLESLVSRPGRLLTYRQIISEVWSERHGDESRGCLRVHLRSLRAKLGDDAKDPRYVETEPGVGCRWVGELSA